MAIIIFITDLVTWGIASLVIAFFYNRKYIEERLSEGYRPVDEVSEDILRRNGYLFDW